MEVIVVDNKIMLSSFMIVVYHFLSFFSDMLMSYIDDIKLNILLLTFIYRSTIRYVVLIIMVIMYYKMADYFLHTSLAN